NSFWRPGWSGWTTRLSSSPSALSSSLAGLSFRKEVGSLPCPSPKPYPACIFNHFLRPPAARSDDATLRLRRSQSPVRTPVVASLSAPAHPYTKINVSWNSGSKRCNFSKFDVDGFRRERLHGPDTRAGLSRSAFLHKEIATGYVELSSLPQSSFLPLAYGTLRRKSDPDL